MGHGDQRTGIFEIAFYLLTQVWSGPEVFIESTAVAREAAGSPLQGPPRTPTLPPLWTFSACPVTLT